MPPTRQPRAVVVHTRVMVVSYLIIHCEAPSMVAPMADSAGSGPPEGGVAKVAEANGGEGETGQKAPSRGMNLTSYHLHHGGLQAQRKWDTVDKTYT